MDAKYEVVKYSKRFYDDWNDFVATSKNGTFLFHRDFMEYHQDRFEDYSLMVYRDKKLVGVLPANKVKNEVHSHQGLTYGGFVLSKGIKFELVLEAFKVVLKFLHDNQIKTLVLKQLPSIYAALPSDETQYLMFLLHSELIKRDTLSVIDLNNKLEISNNRKEGFKRADKHHLIVKEEFAFDLFWNEILIKNLKKKHQTKPVHSLEEITLLKKRFPNQIRQFNVYYDNKIVAGSTVFETARVAHIQYISANEDKSKLGSLDYLFVRLIENIFKDKKYFDFGISNENQGLQINKGLQFWKEGFGARTVAQDFYKVKTEYYNKLENVFI
ncbi:hypothetical protein GCM10007962_19880 [Yeosuana aromativorans]|uniref:BioF2-like acetyltransferase domain-containing protein n=1 Tax=Yeosuana aromativorans TaxID=288019 RepID=A0A8J3BJA0_9FLAO|nr:GNAT family N-acetyltransferase [Yeosuana aromativorans]GGK25610.1 hypothetical protein GCM10007962_19880 [Yeosuana aromativorans]